MSTIPSVVLEEPQEEEIEIMIAIPRRDPMTNIPWRDQDVIQIEDVFLPIMVSRKTIFFP